MIREAKRARTHCTCNMNYRWPVSCFVIGHSQRQRGAGGNGLALFRVNLDQFFAQMPDSGQLRANRRFQLYPAGIAHAIPEAQERAQVGGYATTQKGGSNRTVLIAVCLSIGEAQSDQSIGQDAYRSTRDATPL